MLCQGGKLAEAESCRAVASEHDDSGLRTRNLCPDRCWEAPSKPGKASREDSSAVFAYIKIQSPPAAGKTRIRNKDVIWPCQLIDQLDHLLRPDRLCRLCAGIENGLPLGALLRQTGLNR